MLTHANLTANQQQFFAAVPVRRDDVFLNVLPYFHIYALNLLMTGAISEFSPKGELLDQIKVPEKDIWVTNICFGGPDLRTAYVTSSGLGRLYSFEWHCPGLRLNYEA